MRALRVMVLLAGVAALGAVLFILVAIFGGGFTSVGGSGRTQPDWSPDGERLAYVRFEIGRNSCESSIWARDADGDNDTKLVEDGEHPDWSPDGKRIAFAWVEYEGTAPIRGGIAVMDADGSDVRRIVSTRSVGVCWRVSPVDSTIPPGRRTGN